MQAGLKDVREILSKPGKFYVPQYQRGFEWGEKEFEDLWMDLQILKEGRDTHFLGNIILVEWKDSEGTNRYEIVDGQQRLITISLLACAIRDSLEEEDEVISRVTEGYSSQKNEKFLKIEPFNEEEKSSYEKIWEGNADKANGKIKKAYDFYKERINEMGDDEVNDLKTRVFDRLEAVETRTEDRTVAYAVFQTQNERGKEVEPEILAKTRLFEVTEGLGNEEAIRNRWIELYDNLERNLEDFRFRDSIKIRRPLSQILTNSNITSSSGEIDKQDFYRYFDKSLRAVGDPEEFVSLIEEQADKYIELSNAEYGTQECQINLQYLNSTNTHAEVLSLAIVLETDNYDRMAELFRLAATLGMRMELGDEASASKRDAMYEAARRVRSENEPEEELVSMIDEKSPTDPQIIESLKAQDLTVHGRYKDRTKLVLASIERNRQSREPWSLDLEEVELEHIAPKGTFGSSSTYPNWRKSFNHDEDLFDEYVNKIGNLTLLTRSRNASIGEDSLEEKKEGYFASSLNITEELGDYDEWSPEMIEERTKELANELVEIWSV